MVIKPANHLPYDHASILRARFDAENEAIVLGQIPVAAVFIGDSITENWNLPAYSAETSELILNRGIGGDTAHGVADRFAADVLQLKPQLVVLLIGINDTWVLDDPSVTEQMPSSIEEIIVSGIANTVAQAQACNQRLTLCSMLPVNIPAQTAGNATNDLRNTLILRTNQRVRQLAAMHSCAYINYHQHLTQADDRTLRTEVSSDGIHLNQKGYDLLTAAFQQM